MSVAVDAAKLAGVRAETCSDDGKVSAARFFLIDRSSKFHPQTDEVAGDHVFFS